jgi:hypothetical protein
MRHLVSFAWALALLAIVAGVLSYSGFGAPIHASLQTHLLDWVMGAFCLLWLLIILKVPWDLYFQAQEVFFELQRARERGIPTPQGRDAYIRILRTRLLWLSLAAHLVSAAFVAGIAYATHGLIGYYFAVFYLVSTAFRPAIAGYVYLSRKLRAIGKEAHYPREDVLELRERLRLQEEEIKNLRAIARQQDQALQEETARREGATRELRQRVQDISREFESAISRLTDNQEVIKGIQAFVRLISQSTQIG